MQPTADRYRRAVLAAYCLALMAMVLLAAMIQTAGAAPPTNDELDARLRTVERSLGLAAAPPAVVVIEPPATDLVAVDVRDGQAAHVRLPDALLDAAGDKRHLVPWLWDAGGEVLYGPRSVDAFNAAWIYARPGTYTVTLNGRPFARIDVASDARPVVRVATFEELVKAVAVPAARVELAVPQLDCPRPLDLADGVSLAGAAGRTRLNYVGPRDGWQRVVNPGKGCSLSRLWLDSDAAPANGDKAGFDGIGGANDLTVVDCVAGDLTTFLNCNAKPIRVFAGGCSDESPTSLRAYFIWGEGRSSSPLATPSATRPVSTPCGSAARTQARRVVCPRRRLRPDQGRREQGRDHLPARQLHGRF